MKRKFSLIWRLAFALIFVLSLGLTGAIPVAAATAQVQTATIESPLTGAPVFYTSALASQDVHWNITTTADCSVYTEVKVLTSGGVVKGTHVTNYASVNTSQTDNYTFAFSPALTEGAYTVYISAYAYVTPGAVSTDTQAGSIIVDTSAPTAAITFPTLSYVSGGFGDAVGNQLAGTATDAVSGIASVDVQISYVDNHTSGARKFWDGDGWDWVEADNATAWVDATGTTSWTYPTLTHDVLSGLPHVGELVTAKAGAYNGAGAVGYSSTKTFAYDATFTPTFTLNEIPSLLDADIIGHSLADVVYINGEVYDDLSGVDYVKVQVIYQSDGEDDYYWDGHAWVKDGENIWLDASVNVEAKTWYYPTPLLTSSRYYKVNAKAADNAGNLSSELSERFLYETEGPYIEIDCPIWDYEHVGAQNYLGADGYDGAIDGYVLPGLAVPDVYLTNEAGEFWDGEEWNDDVDNITSLDLGFVYSDCDFDYDFWYATNEPSSDDFTSGETYTITAEVSDKAGNPMGEDSTSFIWDGEGPEVTIDQLGTLDAGTGRYYAGVAETITGTISDDVSGPYRVEVKLNPNDYEIPEAGSEGKPTVYAYPDEDGNWSVHVEDLWGELQEGKNYKVRATAEDNVGNSTEAEAMYFIYDSFPNVRICDPDEAFYNSLEGIQGVAWDHDPGAVVDVHVQISNGDLYYAGKDDNNTDIWTEDDAAYLEVESVPEFEWDAEYIITDPTTYDIKWWWIGAENLPAWEDGASYLFSAVAQDNIGQWGDADTVEFGWDVTAPEVSIQGGIFDNMTALDDVWGTATDTGSGVYHGVAAWIFEAGHVATEKGAEPLATAVGEAVYSEDSYNWKVNMDDWSLDTGDYTLVVFAVDNAWNDLYSSGSVSNENLLEGCWNLGYDTVDFSYTETDDYIELTDGWNFISFPGALDGDYASFDTLLANFPEGMILQAYGYDAFAETLWIDKMAEGNTDANIMEGYWIEVVTGYTGCGSADIAFGFDYNANAGGTVPEQKALKGNAWNAIGPTGTWVWDETDVTEQLASLYTGGNPTWSNLLGWCADDQVYNDTILSSDAECEYMTGGQGYWVFMSAAEGDTLAEYR